MRYLAVALLLIAAAYFSNGLFVIAGLWMWWFPDGEEDQ